MIKLVPPGSPFVAVETTSGASLLFCTLLFSSSWSSFLTVWWHDARARVRARVSIDGNSCWALAGRSSWEGVQPRWTCEQRMWAIYLLWMLIRHLHPNHLWPFNLTVYKSKPYFWPWGFILGPWPFGSKSIWKIFARPFVTLRPSITWFNSKPH